MIEERNGVRNWASILDEGTRLQAEKLARSPAVSGPVALMPDAHVGIGATVGSVFVTENAIIPAAVGVDIGCGMIACRTDLAANDLPDTMQPLISVFARDIPGGMGKGHRQPKTSGVDWMADNRHDLTDNLAKRAQTQLGTLGSGNHFLEVCLDEQDQVWVVVHSGSRGVGNQLAQRHIKLAREQEQALEDRDLAYFLNDTPAFEAYVSDMMWAQGYALQNREIMMDTALQALFNFVGQGSEVQRINCHHNFAQQEEYDGRMVWVTRKGAIQTRQGDYGVIPGSMGDLRLAEGLVLVASGNWGDVEVVFQQAIQVYQEFLLPWDEAKVCYEWAVGLIGKGRDGARDAPAQALLGRALSLWDSWQRRTKVVGCILSLTPQVRAPGLGENAPL